MIRRGGGGICPGNIEEACAYVHAATNANKIRDSKVHSRG
jgi:hypothetical protein